MKTFSKALRGGSTKGVARGTLSALALAATALAGSAPAMADVRVGVGVGLPVPDRAAWHDDSAWRGREGWGDRNQWRGNRGYDSPRMAIRACTFAAERNANRNGYRRADVTRIADVRETRWGYEVRGRIAVDGGHNGWNRGWGWGSQRGYDDDGSFRCKVERGRVTDLDYSGIRGL